MNNNTIIPVQLFEQLKLKENPQDMVKAITYFQKLLDGNVDTMTSDVINIMLQEIIVELQKNILNGNKVLNIQNIANNFTKNVSKFDLKKENIDKITQAIHNLDKKNTHHNENELINKITIMDSVNKYMASLNQEVLYKLFYNLCITKDIINPNEYIEATNGLCKNINKYIENIYWRQKYIDQFGPLPTEIIDPHSSSKPLSTSISADEINWKSRYERYTNNQNQMPANNTVDPNKKEPIFDLNQKNRLSSNDSVHLNQEEQVKFSGDLHKFVNNYMENLRYKNKYIADFGNVPDNVTDWKAEYDRRSTSEFVSHVKSKLSNIEQMKDRNNKIAVLDELFKYIVKHKNQL